MPLDPRLERLLSLAGVTPENPAVGYTDPTGAAIATGAAPQPGGFVRSTGGPPAPTPVSPAQAMIDEAVNEAGKRLERLRSILAQVQTQGQYDATHAAMQQELAKVTTLEGLRQKFVAGQQGIAQAEGGPSEREKFTAKQRLLGTEQAPAPEPAPPVSEPAVPSPPAPGAAEPGLGGEGGGAAGAGAIEPDFMAGREKTITVGPTGEPTVTLRSQKMNEATREAMISLGFNPGMRPNPAQMRAIIAERNRIAAEAAKGKKLVEPNFDPALAEATGTKIGTPHGELVGIAPTNQKARDQIAKLGQVRETLKEIERLSNQLLTADESNPIAQKAQWLQLHGLAATGMGKQGTAAKMFQSTRQGFLGPFARTLSAEVGVLTEGDINRVRQSLPDFGDSRQLARMKMDHIKQLMNTATAHAHLVMTGQARVDDPDYRQRIEALKSKLAEIDQRGLGAQPQPGAGKYRPYSGPLQGE